MDGGQTNTGIGQPVRRREDLRLLTGRGRYRDDLNLRGQEAAIVGPEVCHVGEIVAAVIATSVAAARDAAELVAVDYQLLPSVCHSVIAAEASAPRARQESPNIILDGEVGDPAATEAAFARAAHVVTFDTWVQRVAGVPM